MNLGLFAKGLDLMPDFGYPPVQYGGWSSPRAQWYTTTAAHNTVVVDGANTHGGAGQSTLWAETPSLRAMRASGPGLVGGKQYERTVALMDIDASDAYMLDVFRVVGGSNHTKLTHSTYSTMSTDGLKLVPAERAPAGRADAHLPSGCVTACGVDGRLENTGPPQAPATRLAGSPALHRSHRIRRGLDGRELDQRRPLQQAGRGVAAHRGFAPHRSRPARVHIRERA